jgi:predicted aldo/keto reductase-like oxidoreductase
MPDQPLQCPNCGSTVLPEIPSALIVGLPSPQRIPIPSVFNGLEYLEFRGHGPFLQQWHREGYDRRPTKTSDCIECEVCLEGCLFVWTSSERCSAR